MPLGEKYSYNLSYGMISFYLHNSIRTPINDMHEYRNGK
jgi:hypothetical protein